MKLTVFFISIIMALGLTGCDKGYTLPSDTPGCLREKIATIEQQPVTNPPSSIWQYDYNGKTVYYIPPYCCDTYGELYDENCRLICAPDGGIGGHGDGRCPDFFRTAKNGKLIWRDNR